MSRWLHPVRFAPLLLAASAILSAWWGVHHLPNPDEGAVLTNAAKILDGGVFYRDIDAYPYPAANYAAALAMAVFGEHLGVARAMAGALFCAIVLALYAAALPLLGRERAALFGFSLLAFKWLGFPSFTTYSYWDFSFCFACLALPLLLAKERRARHLFAAGVCIAVAFAAKQSVGVYLAGAIFLQLALPSVFLRLRSAQRAKELAAFASGLAAGVLPMFAYFAAHGVLGAMLHSGFVRPFTGYLPLSGIPAGYMLEWWNFGAPRLDNTGGVYLPMLPWHLLMERALPAESLYPVYWGVLELFGRVLYTSLPIVFVIPLWRWLRSWRSGARPGPADARVFLLAQLAFGFVLSAFPRADWAHIFSVYPAVWLLCFALARPGRAAFRLEWAGVAALVLLTGLLTAVTHARLTYPLRIERASLWIEPDSAWLEPVLAAIDRRVPEGEPFFVYGHEAHVYFLTDRYFDWPFAQLYPGQTGPGKGGAVVERLRRERPRMVYRGLLAWPGTPALPRYAPVLHRHMKREFRAAERFFERNRPPAGAPPEHFVMGLLQARRPEAKLPESAVNP